MIKYNKKYDRYCDDDGNIFRTDKNGELIKCSCKLVSGYRRIKLSKPYRFEMSTHILIWETFNGEIPSGYEIDHINTVRDDNRLCNLRCVTHKVNCNNPITLQHKSLKQRNKIKSEFGKKFEEHYGFTNYEDHKLYNKEYAWFYRNGHCRWEMNNGK